MSRENCQDQQSSNPPEKQNEITELNNEGLKYDGDKPSLALIPSEALLEIAKVLDFGAGKYTADNWRRGFKYRRVISAAMRHILAWNSGEDVDAETGLSHLAHAACCLSFLITFEKTGTGVDDRFTYEKN